MKSLKDQPLFELAGVDWQAAWCAYDAVRDVPPTRAHWDKRSATYARSHGRDGQEYVEEFLAHAGIRPGERVLDFGCGDGLLSIPLAQMGCTVVACDYSQGMLEQLTLRAREAGVEDRIEPHCVAWEDDWSEAGLHEDCVDVALASRSLSTGDMLGSLRKLDAVARRMACVTVAASVSPRRDTRAYEVVGRPAPHTADHAYVLNILMQYGAFPQLSYVTTHPRPGFASRKAALDELERMLGGGLSADERSRLEGFMDAHYAYDPERELGRTFSSDAERPVRWALIRWGTQD